MQLVAHNHIPERPSVLDHARRILKDVLREDARGYLLLTNERWNPATLDDVMRRANGRLKSVGRQQFTQCARWIV